MTTFPRQSLEATDSPGGTTRAVVRPAAIAGYGNVRAAADQVTAQLAALAFHRFTIPASAPPEGNFDKSEAGRRQALCNGKFSKQKGESR